MNAAANEVDELALNIAIDDYAKEAYGLKSDPDHAQLIALFDAKPGTQYLARGAGPEALKLLKKHKADPNYCLVIGCREPEAIYPLYFCTAPYTLSEVLNFCSRMPEDVVEQSLQEFVSLSMVCFKHIDGKRFDIDAEPLLALMACKTGKDHLVCEGYGTWLVEQEATK
jgi:hypothetical protein